MPIRYEDGMSRSAQRRAREEYYLVQEEFGPQATGKSIRARELAESLSQEGKDVLVLDGLTRNGIGGVQVYVRLELGCRTRRANPVPRYGKSTVAAIAAVMADRTAGNGACTESDLIAAGFTPADIARHADAARTLATAEMRKRA